MIVILNILIKLSNGGFNTKDQYIPEKVESKIKLNNQKDIEV